MLKVLKKAVCTSLVATTALMANEAVLLDLSGSMGLDSTNLDKVKKVVTSSQNLGIKTVGFADQVRDIASADDVYFSGSTNLSGALKYVANMSPTPQVVTLVTDGAPNLAEEVLKTSKLLKKKNIKICSIFLANKQEPIPSVLRDISDTIFKDIDVSRINSLCSTSIKRDLVGKGYIAPKQIIDETSFNLF